MLLVVDSFFHLLVIGSILLKVLLLGIGLLTILAILLVSVHVLVIRQGGILMTVGHLTHGHGPHSSHGIVLIPMIGHVGHLSLRVRHVSHLLVEHVRLTIGDVGHRHV